MPDIPEPGDVDSTLRQGGALRGFKGLMPTGHGGGEDVAACGVPGMMGAESGCEEDGLDGGIRGDGTGTPVGDWAVGCDMGCGGVD